MTPEKSRELAKKKNELLYKVMEGKLTFEQYKHEIRKLVKNNGGN